MGFQIDIYLLIINTNKQKMKKSQPLKKRSPRFSHKKIKGWKSRQPSRKLRSPKSRQAIYDKFGARCFLEPKTLGFPVCDSKGRYDCGGIHAAQNRARGSKHRAAKRKAKILSKKGECTQKYRH